MADAKVALVIGAGEATGGAIARRFARGGYTVCATRRNADKLQPLIEQIEKAGGKARELGPEGIHVAHVVIDGAIDTPFIRETFPERYALKEKAGILDPEAIAENYWQLHRQPRSAWTHELDLRPWMEPW